jgi:hypothetical protein
VNRAQTGLPSLAIALLLLTVVTGVGLAVADGALASAERDAGERRVATSLAERLVAAQSPLTDRENVLNATRIERLDGAGVESAFPVADGHRVRIRANATTVAETGDVSRGTTFRRLVLVERRQSRTLQPALGDSSSVTLPRRTAEAMLELTPPANTSVTAVRANDRVLLRNVGGLSGQFQLDLSRFETTELRFVRTGSLPAGSVTIEYPAPETTKTTLEVTVDG